MKALKIIGRAIQILLIVAIFSAAGYALIQVADRYMAEDTTQSFLISESHGSADESSPEEGSAEDVMSSDDHDSSDIQERSIMPAYSS